MIILDPEMNGCIVWLINSPISEKNKVTHIKGETIEEICKGLINRLTTYKRVKNQWGNYINKLCWKDIVYLDITAMGHAYKDVFRHYGLPVEDITPGSPNNVLPN